MATQRKKPRKVTRKPRSIGDTASNKAARENRDALAEARALKRLYG